MRIIRRFWLRFLSWLSPASAALSVAQAQQADPPVINPMLSYPRNARCFCRSGRRFKECCLINPKMPRLIPKSREQEARGIVAQVEILHNGGLL